MSDIEKIQFGEQTFDLVAAGVEANFQASGGLITFQRGTSNFDDIEHNLQNNGVIRQINTSGNIDWSITNLVFDGIITQNPNFEMADGSKVTVLIAKFRLPDVREELKEAKEKLKKTEALTNYISMMTGYDLGGALL